jgi:hypothetical protein
MADGFNSRYVVNRIASGGAAFTKNIAVAPANGDVMKVVYSGSALYFYVNGSLIDTETDSSYTANTYCGFEAYCETGAWRMDDFRVETNAYCNTPTLTPTKTPCPTPTVTRTVTPVWAVRTPSITRTRTPVPTYSIRTITPTPRPTYDRYWWLR